ncbi:hypothetical protein HYT02_03200 [Candidatus Gottesmanbacteria bacterium]|nr:hypothetical protein [Candidatus Gottesmanbacteria bacterium]
MKEYQTAIRRTAEQQKRDWTKPLGDIRGTQVAQDVFQAYGEVDPIIGTVKVFSRAMIETHFETDPREAAARASKRKPGKPIA